MKQLWKRCLAGLLSVMMTVSALPVEVYADLLTNKAEENEEILEELSAFWGDDPTAEKAMELLQDYGLVDEEGNLVDDWGNKISLRTPERHLSLEELAELDEDAEILMDGEETSMKSLRSHVEQMEELGILEQEDWQLRIDGRSVDLSEARDLLEDAEQVTLLDKELSEEEIKELRKLLKFLAANDLLTGTGAEDDWGLKQAAQEEKTSLAELMALIQSGSAKEDMIVVVDESEVAMADFVTMLEIQKEIQRIRDAYLQDSIHMSKAQSENLLALYEQLSEEGIELLSEDVEAYTTGLAHEYLFNSTYDQDVLMTVEEVLKENEKIDDLEKNGSARTFKISLNKPQQHDVTFKVQALAGSATATTSISSGTIKAGETGPVTVTVTPNKDCSVGAAAEEAAKAAAEGNEASNPVFEQGTQGKGVYVLQVYDVENALFDSNDDGRGDLDCWSKTLKVDFKDEFAYYGKAFRNDVSADYYKEDGDDQGTYRDFYPSSQTHQETAQRLDADIKAGGMVSQNGENGAKLQVSEEGLSPGTYKSVLTVKPFTVSRPEVRIVVKGIYGNDGYWYDPSIWGSFWGGAAEGISDDNWYTKMSGGSVTIDAKTGDTSSYQITLSGTGLDGNITSGKKSINWLENEKDEVILELTEGSKQVDGQNVSIAKSGNNSTVTVSSFEVDGEGSDTPSYNVKIETAATQYEMTYKYVRTVKEKNQGEGKDEEYTYKHKLVFQPKVTFDTMIRVYHINPSANAVISAPAGNYAPGQIIPITVTYDYPMEMSNDIRLVVNNTTLHPEEVAPTVSDENQQKTYYSSVATFLYTVPENGDTQLHVALDSTSGNNSSLGNTGANQQYVNVSKNNISGLTDGIIPNVTMDIPRIRTALANTTVSYTHNGSVVSVGTPYYDRNGDKSTTTTAIVTVTLPTNENLRNLLMDKESLSDGTSLYNSKLAVSIDGGQTLQPLKYDTVTDNPSKMIATFVIDEAWLAQYNKGKSTDEETRYIAAEFYYINATVDEKDGLVLTIKPKTETEDGGLLYGHFGQFDLKKPVVLPSSSLAIEKPEGWSDKIFIHSEFQDNEMEASRRTLKAVVTNVPQDCTWSSWEKENPTIQEQVRWIVRSFDIEGNPIDKEVARVERINGKDVIVPYAPGVAKIYLEAMNGDVKKPNYVPEENSASGETFALNQIDDSRYYGDQYSKDIITITVEEGVSPYLRIPVPQQTVRSGQPYVLRWVSNLVQKNMTYGEEPKEGVPVDPTKSRNTTFTLNIYDGTVEEGETPRATKTFIYDPSKPDALFDNGEAMWYKPEKDGEVLTPNQSYTMTLPEEVGEYTLVLSADLNELVPTMEQPVGARHFEASTKVTVVSKPATVRLIRPDSMFQVNDGSALKLGYSLVDFEENGTLNLTVTDNGSGEVIPTEITERSATGGSFEIKLPEGKMGSFRSIYDVSIQARNDTGSAWSRDSFTLYIYDKDALDIIAKEVEGRVTVSDDGNSVTMDNEGWIKDMDQEEILALNRQISLQTGLSINYDAHQWGELIDRIQWSSDDSDTVSVNYKQGYYYEDVDVLPYESYAPATEFLLSGSGDGSAMIEASHLFTDGAMKSEIKVDVKTLKDKLYLFQFYPAKKAVLTYTNGAGKKVEEHWTDKDGRAAVYEPTGIKSDVYVKAEIDGKTYLGTIYQDELRSQEKEAASLELYPLNSLKLREAGSLPIYLNKPNGTAYSGDVSVRFGVFRNGLYCDGAMLYDKTKEKEYPGNEDYIAKFVNGKFTFNFDITKFTAFKGQKEISAADTIQFVLELRIKDQNGEDQYYPILFTANGSVNESDTIRMGERIVTLESFPDDQKEKPFIAKQNIFFAGKESGPSADVRDSSGKIGPNSDYPNQLLSSTILWWGTELDNTAKREVKFQDSTGTVLLSQQHIQNRYPFCSMPVSILNVSLNESQISYLEMEDMESRKLQLNYTQGTDVVKQETMRWQFQNAIHMEKAGESTDLLQSMDDLRDMVSNNQDGMDLSSDFLAVGLKTATKANIESDFMTLRLTPTQDPTVFRGLVYVGFGNESNGYQGNLLTTMDANDGGYYESGVDPTMQRLKDSLITGLQVFGKSKSDETDPKEAFKKRGGGGELSYSVGGYFETEVFYDYDLNKWRMQLVTGGFQAGLGYGYQWVGNFQVGPVPLFLELGAGLAASVEFNAALDHVEDLNHYLTQLQLNAYLNAFGGIGFDYTVVALKLGIFGDVTLTATLRWLNVANGMKEMFGHTIELEGEVGVKAEVVVLFVSYSAVLWSAPFEANLGESDNWDSIEDQWKEVGAGKSSAGHQTQLLSVDPNSGMAVYATSQPMALVSRDYLSQYDRAYSSEGPGASGGFSFFSLFSNEDTTSSKVTETVSNSYSYAAPVLSDDGQWLFYLDDMMEFNDASVVRVAAAKRNNEGGYDVLANTAIDDYGYGDSGLRAAGGGDTAVAVWSRIMNGPAVTEPGQIVTPDAQADMMNSSDIMVAVSTKDGWLVKNLTEVEAYTPPADGTETGNDPTHETDKLYDTTNGLADLSPVVAAKGQNILVAWRQVASGDAQNLLDFSSNDTILYRTSEDGGVTWSDTKTLYNGTAGTVKGLEAAMLDDGTAAVAFTLQDGEPVMPHDIEGKVQYYQEIAYAIIDSASNEVTRYVQLTDDARLDENPQIAAVKLNDRDNQDSFVLGWHTLDENNESDIRLAAIDRDGNRIVDFVDSLSSLIRNSGISVSSTFQFAKNTTNLESLSILWTETAAAEKTSEDSDKDKAPAPSHDYVSAIRFRRDNGKVSVTSAQRLVEMGDSTTIDNFNAYVDQDSGELFAAVQGTYYDYNNPETVQVSDEKTVMVANDKTSIYTLRGSYEEKFRVDSVIPDYSNIFKGMNLPIQFSVTNLGTTEMNSVTVTIDGQESKFEVGKNDFQAIQPGESRMLTAYYKIPDNIVDPEYTVEATFADKQRTSMEGAKGTITLNIPDLGIGDGDILQKAEGGKRTLQFTLYNDSDSALADSKNIVHLQLFKDAACEQLIADVSTVKENALAAIDEGFYTVQYVFDAASYAGANGFLENGEIRDGGFNIYAKAWIEMPDGGEMLEFNDSNNMAYIHIESLLEQADGEHVTIESQLSQTESGSEVLVTLKNNSLAESEQGNVIVTLFDANGNVLEQKQSFIPGASTGSNGLITLTGEEVKVLDKFIFQKKGASVHVTYSDMVFTADPNDAVIVDLFSTLPGIGTVKFEPDAKDPTILRYTKVVSNVSGKKALLVNSDQALGTISINGKEIQGNMAKYEFNMSPGATNTIKIVVKGNGGQLLTYILTIINHGGEPGPHEDPEYDLTFVTNGGSKIATITKNSGKRVDLSKYVTTREGYRFTGWYSDKKLTRKIDYVLLYRDRTVYAGWEKIATVTASGKYNPDTGV